MAKRNDQIFASIKYEGKLVEDGFLDARKASEVLLGIDETLRYFIHQESTEIQQVEFEIPVRIQKGSWEALFPENLDEVLVKTVLAWSAGKYFGNALSEMAKNDFKNLGFKDIFKGAFKGMTWVVKIAIHLGTITKKKFEKISLFKDTNTAEIENEKGEVLQVPIEYLELFSACPDLLFVRLMRIIEEGRELKIGYDELGEHTEIKVEYSRKSIFVKDDDTEQILFPEMKHGEYVEIEGHVTRGNENSNTLGFLYEGHILTCYPEEGKITKYKNALFLNCKMKGFIDRTDREGEIQEKRPKVKFIEIIIIDPKSRQSTLFN